MSNPNSRSLYCPNCGEKLLEGARFCGNCGSPIAPMTDEPIASRIPPPSEKTTPMGWQRPTTEQPRYPSYPAPTTMGRKPGTRPKGVTVIAIIQIILGSVFLLSGLLLGLFMTESMFNDFKDEDPETYEGIDYEDFKLVGYIMLVVGPILIIPAAFSLRGEEWARISSMIVLGIFGVLSLLALFPIGLLTVGAAAYAIYYLNKPLVKEYFGKKQEPYLPPLDQTY